MKPRAEAALQLFCWMILATIVACSNGVSTNLPDTPTQFVTTPTPQPTEAVPSATAIPTETEPPSPTPTEAPETYFIPNPEQITEALNNGWDIEITIRTLDDLGPFLDNYLLGHEAFYSNKTPEEIGFIGYIMQDASGTIPVKESPEYSVEIFNVNLGECQPRSMTAVKDQSGEIIGWIETTDVTMPGDPSNRINPFHVFMSKEAIDIYNFDMSIEKESWKNNGNIVTLVYRYPVGYAGRPITKYVFDTYSHYNETFPANTWGDMDFETFYTRLTSRRIVPLPSGVADEMAKHLAHLLWVFWQP